MLTDPITPEITADALAARLTYLAARPWVRTVLEVGTGSGEGSTAALWSGLHTKAPDYRLVSIEASAERAEAAARLYEQAPEVRILAGPAVPVEAYESEADVTTFYRNVPCRLQRFMLEDVLAWRADELAYLRARYPDHPGLLPYLINTVNLAPDLVLLDGSEFTGLAELVAVGTPPLLVLDDVESFKHRYTCDLLRHPESNYRLLEHDPGLRNGYAIFARADVAPRVTLPPLPPSV